MNSYLLPVVALFATYFISAFLLMNRPSSHEAPVRPITSTASPAPTETHQPPAKPREYIPVSYDPPPEPVRPRERLYRDSKGVVFSEGDAEAKMQILRSEIARMPDNARKAYMQGVLRALEDEWARIRSRGPIE